MVYLNMKRSCGEAANFPKAPKKGIFLSAWNSTAYHSIPSSNLSLPCNSQWADYLRAGEETWTLSVLSCVCLQHTVNPQSTGAG